MGSQGHDEAKEKRRKRSCPHLNRAFASAFALARASATCIANTSTSEAQGPRRHVDIDPNDSHLHGMLPGHPGSKHVHLVSTSIKRENSQPFPRPNMECVGSTRRKHVGVRRFLRTNNILQSNKNQRRIREESEKIQRKVSAGQPRTPSKKSRAGSNDKNSLHRNLKPYEDRRIHACSATTP